MSLVGRWRPVLGKPENAQCSERDATRLRKISMWASQSLLPRIASGAGIRGVLAVTAWFWVASIQKRV